MRLRNPVPIRLPIFISIISLLSANPMLFAQQDVLYQVSTLDALVFEFRNIAGVMVGFRCPEYAGRLIEGKAGRIQASPLSPERGE